MIEYAQFFHYGTIAMSISATSVGVGIGEGIASHAAIEAMNIQPSAKNEISRTAIIGMALIETAAIMGITIATMLLLDVNEQQSPFAGIAELGIAFSISFSGFVLGLVSALPARQAVFAIARQPFFSQKIFRFMLITQSIIQTPIIFGFIIAILIKNQAADATSIADSIRLIASGLCIGLGSVGPAIGLAHFAQQACTDIGINKHAYNKIFSFTFISEAVIETPIIFSLIISLLLISSKIHDDSMVQALAMLASAICIGFGTIGAGIASGATAAAACHQIALNPDQHSILTRTSMFAQGLIDTSAIYCLLISLILLFFH
ncbi:MAG: ATP synthase F0 subunit C [Candidatus Babeliales bacterium]|nr:ATP synthase F0 subunit C [Candidatus Babeliales bacterium]